MQKQFKARHTRPEQPTPWRPARNSLRRHPQSRHGGKPLTSFALLRGRQEQSWLAPHAAAVTPMRSQDQVSIQTLASSTPSFRLTAALC